MFDFQLLKLLPSLTNNGKYGLEKVHFSNKSQSYFNNTTSVFWTTKNESTSRRPNENKFLQIEKLISDILQKQRAIN